MMVSARGGGETGKRIQRGGHLEGCKATRGASCQCYRSVNGQSQGRPGRSCQSRGLHEEESRRGCQGGHLEGCKAAKVSAPGQSMGRARDVRSGVVTRVANCSRGSWVGGGGQKR